MALTALAIRNAKPRAKPYKLADAHSLYLLITPSGAKYWRLGYRFLDKQKTLALGVWPEIGLAEARDKRDAARKLIAEGVDPLIEKRRRKLRAQIDEDDAFSETDDDDDDAEAGDAAAMIELPAPYVSAMIQLRTIRASRSAIMLPSEIRHAARALQGLSLTTEFLGYLACELPAIDGSNGTMDAVFGAMRRADQAKQMVLERHLPQTRAFAQRYLGRGLELDDLVQEANIGLMRAIETFDTERGHRFWTYAQAWVWQRLNRAIADLGSAIRLPVHLLQDRRRLEAVMAERGKVGDRCDPQSLAESSDLPVRTVQRLLSAWTVSALEDAEDWAEDGVAGARLRDDRQADPLAKAVESNLAEEMRIEVEELPPRIAEVVRMRFGLEGRQEHTLEEIGQQYGVTRERIRQLEAKGLKILGHPARSRALRTFLEHRSWHIGMLHPAQRRWSNRCVDLDSHGVGVCVAQERC